MENVEPKSPFVTIIQAIVVGLILVFNAAMTAVFGWDNLAAAFGGESIWAQFAGASYALLIFDLAAVVYLMVYRRNSFTQWQRHVALAMAVICLMGSISATIAQLANTAFGLSVLSEYKATVETISLVVMISLTAVHAIVAATFSLMSNEGRMKDKAISTIATVSDKAFNAAVKQVKEEDHDVLVNTIAADIRAAILNELGFTKDLKQIGAAPGLPGKGTPTPAAQGNGRFYHLDQDFGGRLWFDTEKKARQSAAAFSTVWEHNVEVFREDGTKIAEYGGPSGGIDLTQDGNDGQETAEPLYRVVGGGSAVVVAGLVAAMGQAQHTANLFRSPVEVFDVANADKWIHTATPAPEATQPARPTPAPQPSRAQSNGHAAGYSYPKRDSNGYQPE